MEVTRQQLAEPHFYYNGCEADEASTASEEIHETIILDLAADILLNILLREYQA